MSGICGIVRSADTPLPVNLLENMVRAMEKHGPDGSGCWHDESAGLGHQMMHVTPESLNEHLPFHDSDSQIAITSDARLDNREDLLQALGISPNSLIPDSKLILQAYKKWGTGCAERLVGEFAVAIWDGRDRCLHCVTDPMGIRPMFFHEAPGQYFAFASEVEPLLTLSKTRTPINERRLAMLGVSAISVYLEPDTTSFENIYRVLPATILTVKKAAKKTSEYWKPDLGKRLHFKSDAECKEAYQEVFFKAVKSRLRSAFPVASLLSGGLDSSGIVSAAGRILAQENKKLITLSAVPMPGVRGSIIDEREYIDLFRDQPNLKMRYVSAPTRGPFDEPHNLVRTASLCSYSFQHFLYTAFVRVARRDNARVILDGHGGEYSVSGQLSGYMAELLQAGRWKTLIRELRYFDANRCINLSTIKRHVLRPFFPYALLKLLNRHTRLNNLVEYPIRPSFVQDVLGRDIEHVKDQIFRLLAEYPNHRRNMAADIEGEQLDITQRSHAGFVDYQKAPFSYPYLDKRMLEFGLAVDGRFKHQDGCSRRLIRLGMDGLLPKSILERTSKGPFSPDYHLRYEKEKVKAASSLRDFLESGKLAEIVDFERIMPALESKPAYSMDDSMRLEYNSQFMVPYALYLCHFLDRFYLVNSKQIGEKT